MIRNTMIALLLIAGTATGCQSGDADTKPEAEPVENATTAPAGTTAETTAGAAQADSAELDGLFGGIVSGATTVTITQRAATSEVDFGGKPRIADTAWIKKFVAAVGPRAPGLEAVPKCLPNYTIVFSNDAGEVASFGAVCGSSEAVYLVRGGSAYSAEDSAAARELIEGLAN